MNLKATVLTVAFFVKSPKVKTIIYINSVDNWFQVLRRYINYYEWSVTSGTNSKHWSAYSGYNPKWMAKLMEVKRIYHNYCSTNESSLKEEYKGKRQLMPKPTSPAVRLNLANIIFTASDILSFSLNREKIHLLNRKIK